MLEKFKNFPEKKNLSKAEVYNPGNWELIKKAVMDIEKRAFNNSGFGIDMMEGLFENPYNLNCLLKEVKNNQIIGYVSVGIYKDDASAYVINTAIAPEYQHQGQVAVLMKKLEEELNKIGIKYLVRDASVDNGYADKIQKQYAGRIVENKTYEKMSPWGKQRHFEIKL